MQAVITDALTALEDGAEPAVVAKAMQNLGSFLMSPILEALNSAVQADPQAMHALVCNRVPCNQALLEHPHVAVFPNKVVPQPAYTVDAVGLVNCVLSSLSMPLVVPVFNVQGGEHTFSGFILAEDSSHLAKQP